MTEDDQNLCIAKHSKVQAHFRKRTVIQETEAKYPFIVCNIGLEKLIIQNRLGQKASYIYDIMNNEHFAGFVQFQSLHSLGFNQRKMNLEACSRIVFLTRERETDRLFVNILFIDPYHEQCQIVLFKSRKFFKQEGVCCEQDQAMQRIIFNTARTECDTRFKIMLVSHQQDRFCLNELAEENTEEPSGRLEGAEKKKFRAACQEKLEGLSKDERAKRKKELMREWLDKRQQEASP